MLAAAPQSEQQRHWLAPAKPVSLFFGSDHGGRCWTGAAEAGSWNGVVDDLRVYDYALTADEMRAAAHR